MKSRKNLQRQFGADEKKKTMHLSSFRVLRDETERQLKDTAATHSMADGVVVVADAALRQLNDVMAQHEGLSIEATVEQLLKALVKEGFGNPKEWTALLLLERQVSSAAALKKIHDLYVQLWASAIRNSTLEIEEDKLIGVSRMAHAISYGWYSHDLLFYMDDPITSRSMADISKAITHFIESASI